MEGMISLKKFILGVKRELQEASAEGSKNPFLELTQVELEAEFSLDATASAEGGFKFLVKVGGETSASQSHKVKLIFSPIATGNPMMFAVAPEDATERATSASGTSSSKPVGPTFEIITPYAVGPANRRQNLIGPYFMPQGFGFDQEKEIAEIVDKVMRNLNLPTKGGEGSDEDNT